MININSSDFEKIYEEISLKISKELALIIFNLTKKINQDEDLMNALCSALNHHLNKIYEDLTDDQMTSEILRIMYNLLVRHAVSHSLFIFSAMDCGQCVDKKILKELSDELEFYLKKGHKKDPDFKITIEPIHIFREENDNLH